MLNNLNKEIKLVRKPNCDKISDYKTHLSINFLETKNTKTDTVCNFKHGVNEYINIGFSKENNQLLIESWRLNDLHSIRSFDSLTYNFEIGYSKEAIPFINYIITPDKNIKAKDFDKVLKAIGKNSSNNVYIRTLKDNFSSTDRDIFNYVNIHLKKKRFDFKTDKKINEIIN